MIDSLKRQSLKLIFLFVALSDVMPWTSLSVNQVWPMLDIMLVFIISLYRPQEYPNLFLFFVGVVKDALLGFSLGIHAVFYILLREMIQTYREDHVRDAFQLVWYYFAMFSAVFCMIEWVLMCIIYVKLMPIGNLFIQWTMTLLIYPLVHETMCRFLKYIPNYPRSDAE